jgi:DNA-binding MarR family transcriptional regulator
MDNVFGKIAELDKVVHEPARMAILTALSACQRADFIYLQNLTGLTKGNLSSHLSKLEEAELVRAEKTFEGKKPVTYLQLTERGTRAIENHWKYLDALRGNARKWKPQAGE